MIYTSRQIAKELGTSPRMIKALRTNGMLVGTQLGKRWLYTTEEVEKFLNRCRGRELKNEYYIRLNGKEMKKVAIATNVQ